VFASLRRFVLAATLVLLAPAAAHAADSVTLHDLVIGKPDAPVTINEYSSYDCPHRATFHAENRPWLIKTFVDTGRAKLVFADYPLSGLAMAAAMLVHSAPEDTRQVLSDALFSEQRVWATAENPRQALGTLAGLAGMSQQQVDKALADKALFQALLDRRAYAFEKLGVDSTPTLIINGQKIMANASQEDLTKAIETAEAGLKK
jgi:protein-disulfide isomerase